MSGARIAVAAPGAPVLSSLPPLSLYVHIPWCVRKCHYCDFNSHEARADAPFAAYVDALVADLESSLPQVWGRNVHTVFFGGGTPSLMPPAELDRLLAAIRARLPLAADAEITLEANPGTVEAGHFKAFRDAGVNRLSIGVQSFNDRHLKALTRIHGADEARRAIAAAQACFDNINLDLMFALPGQTMAECEADVDAALAFGTPHISLYHLTIEPNTYFHRYPPTLPDDDLAADMQAMIGERLDAVGYQHYETSAYARPGFQCRHNLNYWRFGDYLGIGAGAHGKISFADRVERSVKRKNPRDYLAALPGSFNLEQKAVGARDLPFEFMLNALRLCDGFTLNLFAERTGLPLAAIGATLAQAEQRGLIRRDHVNVVPTERGRLFLNELVAMFLPEA
ncbi:MAG TPA: radical SAM family heme chaperone HemW [Usitatibacteraceae bacterium]|nr:radical SAM family heme chaperone HemW [Usitatibacteraceae bacterium]